MLAQEQLGGRAAELKTRQELIDALEAHQAKLARRAPKAAAKPLVEATPSAPPVIPIETQGPPLMNELWAGDAPLPKITVEAPVIGDFFAMPPRPDERYGDDQVLTFARDPYTVYAAWDFSDLRFDQGAAQGRVIDDHGVMIQSFAVGSAHGGAFVGQLPGGQVLKIEVRRGASLLGASRWLTLGRAGPGNAAGSSGVSPSSSVG